MAAARRRVPALVDADINEDLGQVTIELTRALIRPNAVINPDRTEELRNAARDNVPLQTVTIEADEAIIRGGDIADARDVEALMHIGLLQSEWDWWTVVRAALFTALILTLTGAALYRLRPQTLGNVQEMAILVVTASIWLLGAKFMIIPHDWLPFLYPLAALSMLIAVLIDLRVGMVLTIAFMFIVQYMDNNALIMVYAGTGALLGALVLGRAERLVAFVWAGIVIALSNLFSMGAFRAPFTDFNTSNLVQLHLIMLLNGGLSASVALIGYFVLGNLFGITTSLQLTELSRPTHPLLRQLLLKSPGTYHHTIVVSNLAERAAAAIGADAFLSRVGAYYHDIGKTVRPYFFTENIADGTSPHEKLDPDTSAQIIISHVKEGLDLADKYHLPPRIRDFIREHHGRSLVKYFYIQAQQQADEGTVVNADDFATSGTESPFQGDGHHAAGRHV
ncbi:MAG: HDIG domain-containing protein [Caldilineaceae bacterium]